MEKPGGNRGSKVLITGGSGLIGRYLTSTLLADGYSVCHLSRGQDQFGRVRVYRWDPGKGILDPVILEDVDFIIHLAGTNLGDRRWTKRRREEIIKSRIDSANLIHDVIRKNNFKPKAFITASGTGYYGSAPGEHLFMEDDPPATDFSALVCRLWEEAADRFSELGIRTVKIRSAPVLVKEGSMLSRFLLLSKFRILPLLGNGGQFLSTIHIKDLCNIYLKAVSDEGMSGAFNAVSPWHTTQKDMVKAISEALNKHFLLVPVPGFLLKLVLGRMSDMALKGSAVSPSKIIKAGYQFEFDNLPDALSDILLR